MKRVFTFLLLILTFTIFIPKSVSALEIPVNVEIVDPNAPSEQEETTEPTSPVAPNTGILDGNGKDGVTRSGLLILAAFALLCIVAYTTFIRKYTRKSRLLRPKFKKTSLIPMALSFLFVTLATAATFIPVLHNISRADSDEIELELEGDFNFKINKGESGIFQRTVKISPKNKERSKYVFILSDTYFTKLEDGKTPDISNVMTEEEYAIVKDEMPENSFGFSLSGVDGDGFSLPPSTLDEDQKRYVFDSNVELTVTLNLNGQLAAGKYDVTIAIADVTIDPTLFDISKMEDMNETLCHNTVTPLPSATEFTSVYSEDNTKIPRVTLTDTRNNKSYLVSKLADGRCWMSENLAYNLSTEVSYAHDSYGNVLYPTSNTGTEEGVLWENDRTLDYSFRPQDANKQTAGVYYNSVAATRGSAPGKYQGVCPDGWELPFDNEYEELLGHYYGYTNNESGVSSILSSPIFNFTKSGYYDGTTGELKDYGDTVRYGTVNSGSFFTINEDGWSDYDYAENFPQIGVPIRCVNYVWVQVSE